ncbi:hypothetical protein BBD41_12420 [Paenibacillus ihbetae]|uniref:Uncharacterized protein n=1 Tax=Paenibacillus ihbetae TaxID=1870820 RepID=A0A1B2E010_9BACL|nr:hypothetical protein [Paenibacillus ihbetae]ANY73320.1 hypothetical protein BBD41_12420 [Paenibacillus ihbetae]
MKFTLFSVDTNNDFRKTKNLIKFLSDDEISVFHFTEIDDHLTHVVFNLKDEYLFGTKLSGNHMNMPVNQYINAFYDDISNLVFLELINEKYIDVILKFLEKEEIKISSYQLTNKVIISVLEKLNGFIKKIELYNDDEEEFVYESVKREFILDQIKGENLIISYLLMLCDSNFISLTSTGVVSVNNNDINTLTKFVGAFS